MGSPSAAISGKYDGEGMWIPWPCPCPSCAWWLSSPSPCTPSCSGPSPAPGACSSPFDPPATTGTSSPSGPSAYLVCQKGPMDVTTGISSKLCGGGGEGIDHP